MVFGLDPATALEADHPADPEPDASVRHLQQQLLLAAWDHTPADADRLSRFLDQLAELRRTASGKR